MGQLLTKCARKQHNRPSKSRVGCFRSCFSRNHNKVSSPENAQTKQMEKTPIKREKQTNKTTEKMKFRVLKFFCSFQI